MTKNKKDNRRKVIKFRRALKVLAFDTGGSRGRVQGVRTLPPEVTCGFLIQLVFCKKKIKTMWFISVKVKQETSAPPPKKILDPPLFDIEAALNKTARDTYLPFELLKTKNQEEIVSKKIGIRLSSPRMKKIKKLNPSCKRTKQNSSHDTKLNNTMGGSW